MDRLSLTGDLRGRGVGTDDINRLTVPVDMIGPRLRIIFLHKDCRLRPDLAMADYVHHAAEREIVIRLVIDGIRMTFGSTGRMVVGKPKNRQVRHLVRRIQAFKFLRPVIDAILIGDVEVERRKTRVHDPRRRRNGRRHMDRVIRHNAAGGRRLAFLAERRLVEVTPGIG